MLEARETNLAVKAEGNQKNAKELYIAAINNKIDRLIQLLQSGVDPNIIFTKYNTTALHGAVFSRHSKVVEVLLQHCADKTIRNKAGKTAIDINKEMESEEIFALLNPEIVRMRDQINQQITERGRMYSTSNTITYNIETLVKVASEYVATEKVTSITNAENALTYMQDAIYYITMCSLEADKYPEDSDERWNIDSKVVTMTQCLAACARYLMQNRTDFVQRSVGIPWKTLAQFVRLEQYQPFFLSHIDYPNRAKVIRETLHQLALTGEYEELRYACNKLHQDLKFCQDGILIRNFSRLNSFFNDEYMAQYIEEAIKNFRDYKDYSYPTERLLRSIMIIGEAFNHTSPVLLGYFTEEVVRRFIDGRHLLCHPERLINMLAIEQVLKDHLFLPVNEQIVPLEVFGRDILSMESFVVKHLQKYKFDSPPIKDDIANYGTDELWTCSFNVDRSRVHSKKSFRSIVSQYEVEKAKIGDDRILKKTLIDELRERKDGLSNINIEFMTSSIIDEIKDINLYLIDAIGEQQINELQEKFKIWVNIHDPHEGRKQQNLRTKLNDPQKAIDEMDIVLKKFKLQYENAKNKSEPLTKEEEKLLGNYPNLENKRVHWMLYANSKEALYKQKENEKTLVIIKYKKDNLRVTIDLIKFCLEQAHNVGVIFNQLNNFEYIRSTSNGYTSRGFSSHPNHHILEFYQVMVGSCARSLLNNQRFIDIAPESIQEIFKKTSKPSRGYLSHIGVRAEDQSFTESKDRAEVFYSNSKQIVEIIPLLKEMVNKLESNLLEHNYTKVLLQCLAMSLDGNNDRQDQAIAGLNNQLQADSQPLLTRFTTLSLTSNSMDLPNETEAQVVATVKGALPKISSL